MQQQFMQLDLGTLSGDVLRDGLAQGAARATANRVWQKADAWPSERLADVAQIHDVMASAPQGKESAGHAKVTPEQLRHHDDTLKATGRRRLTTFAERGLGGPVAAFTELFWLNGRPEIMVQRGPAVHPEHRRHALGRWIKVANLDAARGVNPAARWVRAGNTDDNTGMLAIDRALGFLPYDTHSDWDIDVQAVRAYLARPG